MAEEIVPGTPAPNSTGTTDSTREYSESLWPGPGVWIIVLVLSLAGILVLAPIGIQWGIAAFFFLLILQSLLLYLNTARIRVTPETFTAGKATIERRFIGTVEGFTGEEAFQERGPRLNALSFLVLRGWVDPVVKIEIIDPEDGTPFWLVSTRRPTQLVRALNSR